MIHKRRTISRVDEPLLDSHCVKLFGWQNSVHCGSARDKTAKKMNVFLRDRVMVWCLCVYCA
jgi:hypothetical protein